MITGINSNFAHTFTKNNKIEESSRNNSVRVTRAEIDAEAIQRDLERMREQSKETGKSTNDFAKALKIADRIIAGDIVPDKDDKFLLENYPDMHLRAWLMRRAKEDPERHKSLFEDEDDSSAQGDGSSSASSGSVGSSGEAPAVEVDIELDVSV